LQPVSASSLWGANWGGWFNSRPLNLFEIDPSTGDILASLIVSDENSRAGVLDFASDPIGSPSVVWSLHNTMRFGYELVSYNPYNQLVLSRVQLDEALELQSLAIDPTSGVFYSTSKSALYRLDTSGQATLIGATINPADGALGCDLNGNLYGVKGIGNGPIALHSINKTTGEATPITSITALPGDIAVRPEDGVLYGLGYKTFAGGDYSLYTINRETGAITDLGASVIRPSGLAFTRIPEPTTPALVVALIATLAQLLHARRRYF
jgi:hypothetical protein